MTVTLAVLVTAAVASGIVWTLSRRRAGLDPVDPARAERWLVRWLGDHPRFGGLARHLDRHVAGGLMVAASLTVVFGTALGVGVTFDMVDGNRGIARWDRAVAEWGSRHATDRSTDLLSALTNLGGTGYLCIVAVGLAVYDYVRWRNPNVALFLLTVLAGVALVNNGVKWVVQRDRPDVEHLVGAAGSSFPSGHSAAAAAAWCAFALVLSRHWVRRRRAITAGVAAVIACAVGVSRALLGVHWLSDVVAGLLLGWGWFLLCALAFGGRLQLLGEPAARTAAVTASADRPTAASR